MENTMLSKCEYLCVGYVTSEIICVRRDEVWGSICMSPLILKLGTK
jgi:hypothetical protein